MKIRGHYVLLLGIYVRYSLVNLSQNLSKQVPLWVCMCECVYVCVCKYVANTIHRYKESPTKTSSVNYVQMQLQVDKEALDSG